MNPVEKNIEKSEFEKSEFGKKEFKNWAQIQGVVFKPTLVVIYTDKTHGYILTNRILKDTKKAFRAFLKERRFG